MSLLSCLLSILAFCLFYYYDWCTVHRCNAAILRWGFPVAGMLVAAATGLTALSCEIAVSTAAGRIFWGSCTALSFLFLLKALFFSLPKGTYTDPAERRRVYDKGVYALCRHPGCLAFFLLYGCMTVLLGKGSIVCFSLLCGLNFAYIVLQDRWTFPNIFEDYDDYRRRVPFLVPNARSIARWFGHCFGRKDV